MKKILSALLFIPSLLVFSACGQQQSQTDTKSEVPEIKTIFENISVNDLKSMPMDDDVVILDVRTDEEVAQGAIENSIQIDFFSEDFKDRIAELDPEKTYVVYCRSGGRSSQASQMMSEELGFKNVKNLEGGYNAWSADQD